MQWRKSIVSEFAAALVAVIATAHGSGAAERVASFIAPRAPLPLGAGPASPDVESAARAFVARHDELFGSIDAGELVFQSSARAGGNWSVQFGQTRGEREILFGGVSLAVSESGALIGAINHLSSRGEAMPAPLLTIDACRTIAEVAAGGVATGAREVAVRAQVLRPAVECVVESPGRHRWKVVVDQVDGRLLLSTELTPRLFAQFSGKLSAPVHPRNPQAPTLTLPLPNCEVIVSGISLYTDAQGAFHQAVPDTSAVGIIARLIGRYVHVSRGDGRAPAEFDSTVRGSVGFLTMSDANSHAAERDAFRTINEAHDYMKSVDSTFTSIDISLAAVVNDTDRNGACNAFWDFGNLALTYFSGSASCANSAEVASIVDHEYGHAVADLYARQLSHSPTLNPSIIEGNADLFAAFALDDPRIGAGALSDSSMPLRRLDALRVFPQDDSLDPHASGQIYAGAVWDLRRVLGRDAATRLWHYAQAFGPDANDDSTAFRDAFLAMIFADDDNGTLADGTPHLRAIDSCFARHGIGNWFDVAFTHTPLDAIPVMLAPYPLRFTARQGAPIGAIDTAGIRLEYSTDGGASFARVAAARDTGSAYVAMLPVLPTGTQMLYHLVVPSTVGPIARLPRSGDFAVLVGYRREWVDEFERPLNGLWSVGDPSDDAVAGIWIIARPNGTWIVRGGDSVSVQPDSDHTAGGTRCYVTGNMRTDDPYQDAVQGTTTLFSPHLALAGVINPIIRYWRWYSNDLGSRGADTFRVDIRADSVAEWIPLERLGASTKGWEMFQHSIPGAVRSAPTVQLRFIASDAGRSSLVEAAIDDMTLFGVDSTVGIADDFIRDGTMTDRLEIVPNPSSGAMRIGIGQHHSGSIVVLDAIGREVARVAIAANDRWAEVHPAGLRAGAYLVQFIDALGARSRSAIALRAE